MKLEKSVPFHVKMEQLQKVGGPGGGGGPGTPQPPPPPPQPQPPPQQPPPPQPPSLPKMPAGFSPYQSMHNNLMRSTYNAVRCVWLSRVLRVCPSVFRLLNSR